MHSLGLKPSTAVLSLGSYGSSFLSRRCLEEFTRIEGSHLDLAISMDIFEWEASLAAVDAQDFITDGTDVFTAGEVLLPEDELSSGGVMLC